MPEPSRKATFGPNSYWMLTQRPLQALVFLLPLIVLYEVALPIVGTDQMRHIASDITARKLLYDFFSWFGVNAAGYYLPGLIVVVVLFSWHLARGDPWKLHPKVYAGMWGESVALSVPLFVLMLVLFREPATAGSLADRALASLASTVGHGWQAKLVFGIGAGIYEELLFRLIAIALVHLLLVDILALPEKFSAPAAVVASSVFFALYHFGPSNPFSLDHFVFYTLAGAYLAVIYLMRGFGVVAGTHAMYDVLIVLIEMRS